MFQEFKTSPDDGVPLRHFDDDKMSFESFQFRKSGPKVHIPTHASQPELCEEALMAVEYDSDDFYPATSTTHRPSNEGVQRRKRRRSDEQDDFVAPKDKVVIGKANEKNGKSMAKQMMRWVANPAVKLEELTGWTYTPVSYSFVFLVGIGCGIMYHGWLSGSASDE